MLDLNSALITVVGGLSALNTYWAKSWKDSTDSKLDKLDDKVNDVSERCAKIEGRLNGKVSF
jgi:hypothetical protein